MRQAPRPRTALARYAATARGMAVGVVVAAAGAALVLAGGRAGWFVGTPPQDLGLRDGLLAPPATTPNSVSSQARQWPDHPQREQAHIDALPVPDGAAWRRLRALLDAAPGTRILQREPQYLRVEFHTRWLGFVDDAEFWWDEPAGVVHVRSASRLGESDLGANRQRIETLRAALAAGSGASGAPASNGR